MLASESKPSWKRVVLRWLTWWKMSWNVVFLVQCFHNNQFLYLESNFSFFSYDCACYQLIKRHILYTIGVKPLLEFVKH